MTYGIIVTQVGRESRGSNPILRLEILDEPLGLLLGRVVVYRNTDAIVSKHVCRGVSDTAGRTGDQGEVLVW